MIWEISNIVFYWQSYGQKWPKSKIFVDFLNFQAIILLPIGQYEISFDSQKSQLSNDIFIISEIFFIIEL